MVQKVKVNFLKILDYFWDLSKRLKKASDMVPELYVGPISEVLFLAIFLSNSGVN